MNQSASAIAVGSHPGTSLEPTTVETHISVLFFLGDRVYKLRKPVRYGFVDFTDRATREQDCHREVDRNSIYAPDVYLGVIDLYDRGIPVDHLVVMRRLPSERRLSTMVERGDDVREQIRSIVKLVVDVDSREPRSAVVDASSTRDALRASWERNFEETDSFVGSVLDPAKEEELRRRAHVFLEGRESLFCTRIGHGRIREGHGDLRAEDVYCLDDGPRILDCVEFDERLRFGDVVADLAFLAMDLEYLGRPDLASALYSDYAEYSNDGFPHSLIDHYCASRAYVRAKVACLSIDSRGASAVDEARRLQELSLSFLRRSRVRLVLVGGLPGTGKSTLSEGLGARLDMVVLHSDEVRREIVLAYPSTARPADRYLEEETSSTYTTLLERAGRVLGAGQSVVLDASWTSDAFRKTASELAGRTSSELVELRCVASDAIADARIVRRLSTGRDASEATVDVAREMALRADPWPSAISIDTERDRRSTLKEALRAVGSI